MKSTWLMLVVLVLVAPPASSWEIPADRGTMTKETITAILGANDYPETSTYTQRIEFIDFSANGQQFTQVVIVLTPDKPRLRHGKKLVVVGAEPGSEYGMDFVSTVEHKDGPAIWLAKRGVTFVALTRVGRWNFFAPSGDGSWEAVPMDRRMPIFSGAQETHWPPSDYEVKRSGLTGATSTSVSANYRFPKRGTALEKQMLAATPRVFIEGYRLALEQSIPDRRGSIVFFWGMSTGGAILYLELGVEPVGLGERLLIDRDQRVQVRTAFVVGHDTVDVGLGNFAGGRVARPIRCEELTDRDFLHGGCRVKGHRRGRR